MSYHSILLDRVHIVRWQRPELADTMPMVRELRQAALKLGKKVIGVSIVPDGVDPPSEDTKTAMAKRMNDVLEVADSVHFVMEGTGFRQSIMRSALSGMLLVGGKRGRVFVHKNIDQALKLIAPQIEMTPEMIKKLAREKGMILV
jgi:hypothetical protein